MRNACFCLCESSLLFNSPSHFELVVVERKKHIQLLLLCAEPFSPLSYEMRLLLKKMADDFFFDSIVFNQRPCVVSEWMLAEWASVEWLICFRKNHTTKTANIKFEALLTCVFKTTSILWTMPLSFVFWPHAKTSKYTVAYCSFVLRIQCHLPNGEPWFGFWMHASVVVVAVFSFWPFIAFVTFKLSRFEMIFGWDCGSHDPCCGPLREREREKQQQSLYKFESIDFFVCSFYNPCKLKPMPVA